MRTIRPSSDLLTAVRLVAMTLAFLCVEQCPKAIAQTPLPSQLTPPSLAPLQPRTLEPVPPSLAPGNAPQGIPDLAAHVREFVISGGYAQLENESSRLLAAFRGKRLTVNQLYAIAQALEALYAQKGYVLVRVSIPPQELSDGGTFKFTVIDGYIEHIDTQNLPERTRTIVGDRLGSLLGRKSLLKEDLERALLLAGDVPGLSLTSTLERGDAEGAVRLILGGKFTAVSGSSSGNNCNPVSLGTWQTSTTLSLNNTTGLGEQLYVSSGGDSTSAGGLRLDGILQIYSVGFIVPSDVPGLVLNPEFTHSRTQTPAIFGVPASEGVFNRFALRAAYAITRTRERYLDLTLAAEHIDQLLTAEAFSTALNHDSYWVARGGLDFSGVAVSEVAIAASVQISRGLGGRSPADALATNVPLSQAGSDPEFNKVWVTLLGSRPLMPNLRTDIIFRGQTSFNHALMLPEKFALDGTQSISSFKTGSLSVDSGMTLRGEIILSHQAIHPAGETALKPYVFAAYGHGVNFVPTADGRQQISAKTFGLGLRTLSASEATTVQPVINLELARTLSDMPGQLDNWQFVLSAGLNF